jgi:hypothetical protein
MANEISFRRKKKPTRGKVYELLSTPAGENSETANPKRERFLELLKSQYGYTNEKAVDELERLLKQFYRMNKGLGLHHIRPVNRHPTDQKPD